MSLRAQETRIAGGGPGDFPTVRHLILQGSNYEIGRHLATLAMERYGVRQRPTGDPQVIEARRLYFRQHYPILLERARGVADAYGISLEDNRADLVSLMYPSLMPPKTGGCSVVFYPPQTTTHGHGLLSRNLDAQTGSLLEMLGAPAPPGIQLKPAYSEPYIMEVYPDVGYASLYLACTDLLGACYDGVNAEGLAVSLMGDGDPSNTPTADPQRLFRVGINELQVLRLLLDTCATVEEAQRTLLLAKHYTVMLSCHYLIADRQGHSFVWEHTSGHNQDYILEGSGAPQVVTNHPLYSMPAQVAIPEIDAHRPAPRGDSYQRYRALSHTIEAHCGRYSVDVVKAINACVFADDAVMREYANFTRLELLTTGRTLWHSVYDTHERSLEISFYLRDEPDGESSDPRSAIRSDYYRFRLD
jgi:hypothetical protein